MLSRPRTESLPQFASAAAWTNPALNREGNALAVCVQQVVSQGARGCQNGGYWAAAQAKLFCLSWQDPIGGCALSLWSSP